MDNQVEILAKLMLYVIIVISAVFHEYAHGFAAYRLGDPTAKYAGRLTLNPFAHMDLIGTVLLPLALLFSGGIFIGWAKPVPYNPYNLSDQKYGSLKVALAGPAANLIIALGLGLFLRFALVSPMILQSASQTFFQILSTIIYINIVLFLFNLIPFPPLDGSKILTDLFPQTENFTMQTGAFGIILALLLAFYIISPVANFIFSLITGVGGFT
ncbi:site-2 protease family protein [Candidatus Giovannonibacteria bacterium]|nr:site-2 protease family protein [Candidatus Giovannonibacteria bacterium]